MDSLHLTLFPFLISAIVSLVITPVVIYVYKYFGWVVDPKKAKHPAHTHTKPVPKGGGIPVFLGTLLATAILLPFDGHLKVIFGAGLLVVIVGTLDDVLNINPYVRLGANLMAALIVIGSGIGIAFITNPLQGGIIQLDQPRLEFFMFGEERSIWVLADLLALLWIPFLMNAINWSKGLDGQLPGIVVVAGVIVGLLSLEYSADVAQWPVAIVAFALAGAYAGYLPFNFYPQKSMPGYAGGSFAGFILATLAILSTTKIGTALVVLGVPVLDAIFVGLRRIAKGRSPVWGDNEHLHHYLMRLGWGKRRIAVFYWVVTAVLGVAALKLNSTQKLYTMVLTGLLLGVFLIWVSFGRFSKQPGQGNG